MSQRFFIENWIGFTSFLWLWVLSRVSFGIVYVFIQNLMDSFNLIENWFIHSLKFDCIFLQTFHVLLIVSIFSSILSTFSDNLWISEMIESNTAFISLSSMLFPPVYLYYTTTTIRMQSLFNYQCTVFWWLYYIIG